MKVSSTNKLVLIGLMTGLSLGIYALECLVPAVPLPGVKLGLSNVITLICLYIIGGKASFAVLTLRILISSMLFGQPISLIISIFGGILAFFVMLVFKYIISESNIWAVSVFGAFAHNIGQLAAVMIITNEVNLMYYFLVLVISSIVSGVFTGVCAGASVNKLKKIEFN